MSTVAIFQLIEAGRLDLVAPIQKYLPDFPKKKKGTITTRHLLSHASGIGAYKNGKESENKIHYASLMDALVVFQDRELQSAPGTSFNYTSYGYVVLGMVIEEISSLSYEFYMKKNVFDPAEMTNTATESEDYMRNHMPPFYHKKVAEK
ncbi:MAG: CubicO group peptidase (beta-lactamase class C family) [Saprospiraceae bacterium]|jgi:CubicO group peptidase (beta-lactamase class C family)